MNRNTLSIFLGTFLLVLILASCTKNYTCTCDVTQAQDTVVSKYTIIHELKAVSKKTAQTDCWNGTTKSTFGIGKTSTITYYTYNCKLN